MSYLPYQLKVLESRLYPDNDDNNNYSCSADNNINRNHGNGQWTLDQTINYMLDVRAESIPEGQDLYMIGRGLNRQSQDLGMGLMEKDGRMSNRARDKITEAEVERYLDKMEKWFPHIFILERLDESLMLFKEDMCWEIEDLFYLGRMKSNSKRWVTL
eukprot:sb/3473053/